MLSLGLFGIIRDKSTTPSGFTLKLRKHIRTRRLEDVRQLGIDRVHFALLLLHYNECSPILSMCK
jgi:hypothetical protein